MVDWGGKAGGLKRMMDHGCNVPPFLVLDAKTDIEEVRRSVDEMVSPEDLLAVRSSAAQEDGDQKSFAGQFHSEIAVSPQGIDFAWKSVVDSLPKEGRNAVVIQTFIEGDYSGVCFVDAQRKQLMIDYLPGLCAAVVGGNDVHHVVLKANEVVLHKQCAEPLGLVLENGETIEKPLSGQLTEELLQQIANNFYNLSQAMNVALDIEWTVKGETLYFLQARHITREVWDQSEIRYYDSANVGESYGGIVLPLTISFAQRLYSQVYQDLLMHSGVPRSYLKNHVEVFDRLVDGAFGRMYYRMEHWYAFLSMLPGYKRNKQNLEHMLLLQKNEPNSPEPIKPLWHVRLLYYPRVVWKLLRFGNTMRSLERETKSVLLNAGSWNYQNMTPAEARSKLNGLFEGILRKWYLTVENDTVVMSLFASMSAKKSLTSDDSMLDFHSVSTEQVEQLISLSQVIENNADASAAIDADDAESLKSAISNSPELLNVYHAYFERFGGRFANELKLESPGLEDDMPSFLRLIRLYRNKPANIYLRKPNESKEPFLVRVFKRFASRREVFRLYRAEMFSVVRRLIMVLARAYSEEGLLAEQRDIFFLNWDEMIDINDEQNLLQKIEQRKLAYRSYQQLNPPDHFTVVNGRWPQPRSRSASGKALSGMSACKGKAGGNALVMPHFEIPSELNFDILVTKRTDPGWTPLMALSKGLVVEHGGMLSHASIVARELGIPTIIGVEGACEEIQTGDLITVDADAGNVYRIENSEHG